MNLQTFIERDGATCLTTRDPEGHTALHWACYRGHGHLVRYLLSVGDGEAANTATTTPPRQRPIHWSCVNGSIEIVDMLLDAGVSVDQTDDKVSDAAIEMIRVKIGVFIVIKLKNMYLFIV